MATLGAMTLKRKKQKLLSILGMLSGSCFIITVLGNVTGLSFLVQIGMGLGGLILVPAWFISNGILLLKGMQTSNETN